MGDGPWNATVTLHSGLAQQSYRAQITFPPAPGTAPAAAAHPARGGFGVVTILISAVLIVLVATLASLIIITYRRRRLDRAAAEGPGRLPGHRSTLATGRRAVQDLVDSGDDHIG